MSVRQWRCPVPGCASGPRGEPWRVHETVADVTALVEDYASEQYGELPEPMILGPMRAQRVIDALTEHLAEHPEREVARLIP